MTIPDTAALPSTTPRNGIAAFGGGATMLVGFARYSRDRSFVVLSESTSVVWVMAAGYIVGTFVGGQLLWITPSPVLLPLLAVSLVISAGSRYGGTNSRSRIHLMNRIELNRCRGKSRDGMA
jgi:hypothetical protein